MPLLWKDLEPPRHTLFHIKGVSRALMHLKFSWSQGIVTLVVGMSPRSFVDDVEGLCDVFWLFHFLN